jgi:glycosyltransferase involved in cell wall biosynthesis
MSTEAPAGRVVVAMISRNEAAAVGPVLDAIRAAAPAAAILLVDSSTDDTAAVAEARGATVIRQIPPRGYGPAMMTALRAAAERSDVVVTLDCDGTYPADRIPALAALVLDEGWDVVNATRLGRRPEAMPLPNWLANTLFAAATRALHGLRVTDVHTGMRAYRSSLLRAVDFQAEGPALPVELLIKPARLGYRVVEVEIPYGQRIGDSTLDRFDSTVWTLRRILRLTRVGRRVRASTGRA